MILPFTTNQWNAIRFVTLNLISVPLIELALHRLHQLGVANRILRGRKARVRPSFLANWGLHQEVDELSVRSRITAFIVAFCYVGFSLCTEYASGSRQVPKKSVWEPPVMRSSLLQDKPALFDTTLMPAGPFRGCRSKKSRERLQQLLEHIVKVRVYRYAKRRANFRSDPDGSVPGIPFIDIVGEGSGMVQGGFNLSAGKLQPVSFSLINDVQHISVVAEMHDEETCFRRKGYTHFVCFSSSENVTISMILGNILLFDGNLPPKLGPDRGYLPLLSTSAFDFECEKVERIGKSICEAFAQAHTPREFSNALNKVEGLMKFNLKFKYDFGPADITCREAPRIEPPLVKVPEKAKLSIPSGPVCPTLPSMKRTKSFGIFHGKMQFFQELQDSRGHCSMVGHLSFCAQRHSNGTSLIRLYYHGYISPYLRRHLRSSPKCIAWTLNWTSQDLELPDLSRGTLAYSIVAKRVLGKQSLSAQNIADVLKKGIPKLTQVGSSGIRYDEIVGDDERATVFAWVLGIWATILLIAVNYLLFIRLSKVRLFPDVYLLYCHSVMRKHTRYNNGKSIRTAPTAAMASANGIVTLDISYDDLSAGEITVDDMLQ